MAKIISFEGGIGAGKSTLVDFFSTELGLSKILEHHYKNPFIDEFYSGANVKLETELSFLLQHYSLVKSCISKNGLILSDFSIEKDLVFARMNLDSSEFDIFSKMYNFVVKNIGLPDLVIYLDLSPEILLKRINKRGRPNEINIDPNYFQEYSERLKSFFMNETKGRVYFIKGDNDDFSPKYHMSERLNQINKLIQNNIYVK